MQGMMVGMDQKDGEHLALHNPQRTQGCALKTSLFAQERMPRIMFETFNGARGSCGSPEKAQASARVDSSQQAQEDCDPVVWKHLEKRGVHRTPSRRGATGSW